MARLKIAAVVPVLLVLLSPVAAFADDVAPYRTVIDGVEPPSQGLSITGTAGGCDLLLDNATGSDVVLFDGSVPPKPVRFPAPPKGDSTRPPLAIHLAGAWPCASLPTVDEDQRWNHQAQTVLVWGLKGQLGTAAFQLRAHTDYDPSLDPASEWMFYLRILGGVAAVAGPLLAIPWLLGRRRAILGKGSAAAGVQS